ncbi:MULTISPECIES: bifunctional cobalt-precorrin-7 (C(5))-methyltransferase/cobalt-precorrin-6B (C(15))-methyltransferase [Gordonia]|uniref:Precorrin-6Y C5,15-methyltransferase n=1 Tax=Gordonia sihwensis NBRC 108236 TaxID=1223544 RepID=L7LEY7_9ACTN|nr:MULTISPECIES: bifunctional cobalt-precorrin-7 (C(5))-methyltransferase/cobalt-precorrin-6B (C(15))-methyltransferase [Gordonia]AUH69007.1 bifunctional cobalt-precorrin-7 (C(5))-methyltransferase/cobalt-precorrin-6B (C(15))-methyltransferase [Gordonia sp. YC-JH1]MBY4570669.1 bifunctional cobalt-precorrin-7 (C(5))-methyltransferase/cobalt-precorrin-6B (C(15))-methyltransferase [Gordonia sihwensis]WFN94735.1 bifunctional cobalt-precorrin-7 (C(5))-methyltransferase/cobalt-precorrin-6B (C(15))-met
MTGESGPKQPARFVVVGIGADGWSGLSARARAALDEATTVYGSARQLDLVAEHLTADTVPWRSPMSEHLREVLRDSSAHGTIHVLASGDPMFHGIGSTIVRQVGRDRVTIVPAPSSVSLAAAELGWDLASTTIVSTVTAPASAVVPELGDGIRLLVLSRDGSTPAEIAELCRAHGYGWTTMSVLENLGAATQAVRTGLARSWDDRPCAPLNITALDCVGPSSSHCPGLPDEAYEHDGQLTKQTVRALSVSALAPAAGQLLWDVGAGAGSIGIEWLRCTRDGRAVAFEADRLRAAALRRNAEKLGVGHRLTLAGAVPEALAGAADPDAVFLGGGVDRDVLDTAWDALMPGGRIVGNAVAIETQHLFIDAQERYGGSLTRLSVERAAPLGRLTAWRPALPIVQWVAVKDDAAREDT